MPPILAYPIAKPAMPFSDKGVLKTLSLPYFSLRPDVHRKTPPKATSSPKTMADESVAMAIDIASLIAVKRFMGIVFLTGLVVEVENDRWANLVLPAESRRVSACIMIRSDCNSLD